MCPGSDIESRGNANSDHHLQLRNVYNEESQSSTDDEDKVMLLHGFLRKIQVMLPLPLNETRDSNLNQATLFLFLHYFPFSHFIAK